jgi:hypothetical protein
VSIEVKEAASVPDQPWLAPAGPLGERRKRSRAPSTCIRKDEIEETSRFDTNAAIALLRPSARLQPFNEARGLVMPLFVAELEFGRGRQT